MGTHFDYERSSPCRGCVANKGAEDIGAVDWKQPSVLGCVLVKGLEAWRMPGWRAADWRMGMGTHSIARRGPGGGRRGPGRLLTPNGSRPEEQVGLVRPTTSPSPTASDWCLRRSRPAGVRRAAKRACKQPVR